MFIFSIARDHKEIFATASSDAMLKQMKALGLNNPRLFFDISHITMTDTLGRLYVLTERCELLDKNSFKVSVTVIDQLLKKL